MGERLQYTIEPTTRADIPAVIALLKTEPDVVVPLTEEDLQDRIGRGFSYVAKNADGDIFAHQGVKLWPQSGIPELGSAVVLPSYREKGVNTSMKRVLINVIREQMPDSPILGFIERASQSGPIFRKLGFDQEPVATVPEECYAICPVAELGCHKITKVEPPPCGCQVFYLQPGKEVPVGK